MTFYSHLVANLRGKPDTRYLDCFRKYEQQLTDPKWSNEGQEEWNLWWSSTQISTLPDYVDADLLKGVPPICRPDADTALFSNAELEQALDFTAALDSAYETAIPWPFFSDDAGLSDCVIEGFG